MNKSKLRTGSRSSTQVQVPPPGIKFKIGDRATIDSTHPTFPGEECTITAFPSPDGAIVELEDGKREYVQVKYILCCVPNIEQTIELNTDLKSRSKTEIANAPCEFSPSESDSRTTIEVIQELSPDEERERHRLELRVGRAFYEAGAALRELRDKRLYRSTHKTFQEYCTQRFGMTRRKGDYLISAAGIFENLEMRTNRSQILPTNLEQVRPLMSLPQADEQWTVWSLAVEENDGRVPTGKLIKGIVERMKEKPLYLASQYCEMGEVFFLQQLCGEERKYNGCWAIAIQVENRFTVKAAIFRGFLEVKQENIERIDCEQTQAEIRDIYQRIEQLMKCQLDPIDEAQIEILCRRPWFTNRQKQALSAMEDVYQLKVKP